jgi:hypothetical protein
VDLGIKIRVLLFSAIGEPLAGMKDEVVVKESERLK